jgi:hypothetical protein
MISRIFGRSAARAGAVTYANDEDAASSASPSARAMFREAMEIPSPDSHDFMVKLTLVVNWNLDGPVRFFRKCMTNDVLE